MRYFLLWLPFFAAAALSAGCAANGDPPPGSNVPTTESPSVEGPSANAATAAANAPNAQPGAAIEARDVAVLVLEQTPSSLRVTSSATRPRAAFGPAAGWNGAGAATHTWTLLGMHGETLASGGIVAKGSLEAPPNPTKGAAAANVPQDTFSFMVKVPQPAPGERIEITPIAGSTLVARWP